MKGVSFITDETHNKRFVQLDLAEISMKMDDEIQDLIDLIICESRKDDPKIELETLGAQLKAEKLL